MAPEVVPARPPSRFGGYRPDGTYAEGPSGFRNGFWAWLGQTAPGDDRALSRAALQAEREIVETRRARRRAAPPPALLQPHPRTCRKAVRLLRAA